MTSALWGLIGVFVGFMLNVAKDLLLEGRRRSREAQFLAARVIPILDDFVDDCLSVVSDDGLCQGQRDNDGCLSPQVHAPELLTLPTDVNWRSIDHKLMLDLLALPSQLKTAHSVISAVSEYEAGPPDYEEFFAERKLQFGRLGERVAKLADKMRTDHSVWTETLNRENAAYRLNAAAVAAEKAKIAQHRPWIDALDKIAEVT